MVSSKGDRAGVTAMKKKRVLVYHTGSLGDTIVAVPALQALRRHYGPGTRIVMAHNQGSSELAGPPAVLLESDLVNEFVSYHSAGNWLGRAISAIWLWCRLVGRFGTVVYLRRSGRTRIAVNRDEHFFRLCGIQERIGFSRFHGLGPGTGTRGVHEADVLLETLRAAGIPAPPAHTTMPPFLPVPQKEREVALDLLKRMRSRPRLGLITVAAGCKMEANRWPLERFIELAHRLDLQGAWELAFMGGSLDHQNAQRVIEAIGAGINLCGLLSPLGSAAVLAEAIFHIGLDTGTTHLAAAVGTPCVAVYGGRNYVGTWDPLGGGHIVVRHGVPCTGCGHMTCPLDHHPCMSLLSVDDVWAATEFMITRSAHAAELAHEQ